MLKFITEDYLKNLYRKEPFTSFVLEDDQRLTPGGRQYLLDKGIKINSNLPTDSKKEFKNEEPKVEINKDINLKMKKLSCKFKSLETLFISSASEILYKDIKLAQKVVDLSRNIKNIREFIEGKCELETITPKDSNGKANHIEITDIYIHLKNSKEILNLYYVFCKLEEFKYDIEIEFEDEQVLDKVLLNLTEIENILSGIIKEEAGEE